MKTYAKARADLLEYLSTLSWQVHLRSERAPWAPLKIPYAITPGGSRVNFKPQAVYLGEHSLRMDIRQMSGPEFMNEVLKTEKQRRSWDW